MAENELALVEGQVLSGITVRVFAPDVNIEQTFPIETILWDGDDVHLADPAMLERVAEHFGLAPGTLDGYKVTRPETGHIVISRQFAYG
jgi:hypothetical protein